jgi:hypothetical protein
LADSQELEKRKGEMIMRIKSNAKAGGINLIHNQMVKALRIKSRVKAGKITSNHNQKVAG